MHPPHFPRDQRRTQCVKSSRGGTDKRMRGGELANQGRTLSEAQLRFRKAKNICARLFRMRQVPPPAQVGCQHVKQYCRGGDGMLGTKPDDPPVHRNT